MPLRFLRNKPPGSRDPPAQTRRKQHRVPAPQQETRGTFCGSLNRPGLLPTSGPTQRSGGTRQGSSRGGGLGGICRCSPWKSPTGSRGLAPGRGGFGPHPTELRPSRGPAGHPAATPPAKGWHRSGLRPLQMRIRGPRSPTEGPAGRSRQELREGRTQGHRPLCSEGDRTGGQRPQSHLGRRRGVQR